MFGDLPSPAPIQCAWRPYQRGQASEALIFPWLAQRLNPPPETLGFRRDTRGRPFLTGLTGDVEDIDVNWSHSGQALLVALGRQVRVGVDLEFQRPRHNALALAERFFAPSEAAQLQGLPDTLREAAFTRLWCAKEAVLKAQGQGISYGLDRLVFALQGDAWQLMQCDHGLGQVQDWNLHSFAPGPGYLAALAWRRPIIAEGHAGQQVAHVPASPARG